MKIKRIVKKLLAVTASAVVFATPFFAIGCGDKTPPDDNPPQASIDDGGEDTSTDGEDKKDDTGHDHIYGEWQSDENQHWKKATCGHNEETGRGNHVDENGDRKCDVCARVFIPDPQVSAAEWADAFDIKYLSDIGFNGECNWIYQTYSGKIEKLRCIFTFKFSENAYFEDLDLIESDDYYDNEPIESEIIISFYDSLTGEVEYFYKDKLEDDNVDWKESKYRHTFDSIEKYRDYEFNTDPTNMCGVASIFDLKGCYSQFDYDETTSSYVYNYENSLDELIIGFYDISLNPIQGIIKSADIKFADKKIMNIKYDIYCDDGEYTTDCEVAITFFYEKNEIVRPQ